MNEKNHYRLKEYLLMTAGSTLTAIGIGLFTVPAKIVDGGVSGIATILYHLQGWPVAITTLCISIPLFLLGLLIFGNTYGFKSLAGSLLLSFFLSIIEKTIGLGGLLDYSKDSSLLLSAAFGGMFCGFGIGLVMRGGANTGGTDILAQCLAHYTPLSQGTALFCIDGCIIAISACFFGVEAAMYGVITAFISTQTLDKVVVGFGTNRAKSVFIISAKHQMIEQAIMQELGHGGTIFAAKGMFSGQSKPVVMCVIMNHELAHLTRIVHQADPRAFMIVQEAYEVLGEGFTPIEDVAWSLENDVTQKSDKPTSPKASQDNSGSRSSS